MVNIIMNICSFGCGNEAKHQLKNGQWCCNKVWQKCPGYSNISLNINEVKKIIEKEGHIWVSGKYKNSTSKIKLKCPNNHEYTTSWYYFYHGRKCTKCNNEKFRKEFLEKIKCYCNELNYKCLSTKYVNNTNLLEFKCNNEHIFKMNWQTFRGIKTYPCPTCRTDERYKKLKDKCKEQGFILLATKAEFENNNNDYFNFKCPEGHVYKRRRDAFNSCAICDYISRFGEGNPSWKGGICSDEYCELWAIKEYKEMIKKRDNNRCLNPYCSGEYTNNLVLHHIDYNKKNCSEENLITICNSCNSKANTDREWHMFWYQTILQKRYNFSILGHKDDCSTGQLGNKTC